VLGLLSWPPKKEFLDNLLLQNCWYILCTLGCHEQLFSKLPVGLDRHEDILILEQVSLDIFDLLFHNCQSSFHLADCHFEPLYKYNKYLYHNNKTCRQRQFFGGHWQSTVIVG
jgi:hypothetical protein